MCCHLTLGKIYFLVQCFADVHADKASNLGLNSELASLVKQNMIPFVFELSIVWLAAIPNLDLNKFILNTKFKDIQNLMSKKTKAEILRSYAFSSQYVVGLWGSQLDELETV